MAWTRAMTSAGLVYRLMTYGVTINITMTSLNIIFNFFYFFYNFGLDGFNDAVFGFCKQAL